MSNPTQWLDYVVIATLLVCAGFAIATSRTEVGARKGRLRFAAEFCFASVFLLAGLDTFLTRELAQRSHTSGVITALEQHGGKRSYSLFVLTMNSGQTVNLRIDSNSKLLEIGEQVAAEWMQYNNEATRLDILTGPNTGDHLRDAGPFYGWLDLALGLWLIHLCFRSRRFNPSGEPRSEAESSDRGSGVDELSLLNLNRR